MTDETIVPSFANGVRLREDVVRGGWVVLAPERLFMPDQHALAVLKLVDGTRSVGEIVDQLAAAFDADRKIIAADVIALLRNLAGRGGIQL